MSRIGRMPVVIPAGVTVQIGEGNHITVKGPLGTLERTFNERMSDARIRMGCSTPGYDLTPDMPPPACGSKIIR